MRRLAVVLLLAAAISAPACSGRDGKSGPVAPPPHAAAPATPPAPASSVRGVVRDADGAAVAGARVTLHPFDPSPSVHWGLDLADSERTLGDATTGADGTFELAAASGGSYAVVAAKDGCVAVGRKAGAGDEVALPLRAGRTVVVRFVDIAGVPVAGASIHASDAAPDWTGVDALTATTDADGTARVVLAPETGLHVRAEGFTTTPLRNKEIEERTGSGDPLILDDGGVIAGVVVDSAGAPIQGAKVRTDRSCTHPTLPWLASTGAEGSFRLEGFDRRDTPQRVFVHCDGYCSEDFSPEVGRTDLRIVLRRPATVRGVVVREDGSPAGGARVTAAVYDADELGRFESDNFDPQSRSVRACWPPISPTLVGSAPVDLSEGGVAEGIRIVLREQNRRSRLTVRVVDASGAPSPRAVVAVRSAREVHDLVANDDGSARDEFVLAPGTAIRLLARPEGAARHGAQCASGDAVTSPCEGAPPEPVVLRLGPPGKLTVRLEDADGREIPRSRSRIRTHGSHHFATVPDAFPLHPMIPLTVEVDIPGLARRNVRIDAPHPPLRELTLRLAPEARLTGRVVGEEGVPPPGADLVVIRVPSEDGGERDSTDVGEDGTFEFGGLPDGEAELVVFDARRVRRTVRTVGLAAGKTTSAGDLVFAPMGIVEGIVADERGSGICGARLRFVERSGEYVATPRTSGPDGRFRVRLPLRGGIRILALREGYGAAFTEIDPEGTRPLRVALRRGGRVRMTFPAEEFVIPEPRARVAGADEGSWWTPIEVSSPGDGPGDWTLDGFPEGDVELSIRDRAARRSVRVRIVAGETVEARF